MVAAYTMLTNHFQLVSEIASLFVGAAEWRENCKAFVDEKLASEERLFDKVHRRIYLGTEE